MSPELADSSVGATAWLLFSAGRDLSQHGEVAYGLPAAGEPSSHADAVRPAGQGLTASTPWRCS
ncbi:hypothetical protein OHA72_06095 [Dactylosporangium sp. NBC_01737]|uniref:hypothetical protein n=1 Tax=Dactylosporangium sp. NBC_01737 TaxID=2975959 RepID=UPI002E11FC22|nr:hypothetical protein OHA72_06095 [Dactylosporangium sp. NBC_01737]